MIFSKCPRGAFPVLTEANGIERNKPFLVFCWLREWKSTANSKSINSKTEVWSKEWDVRMVAEIQPSILS